MAIAKHADRAAAAQAGGPLLTVFELEDRTYAVPVEATVEAVWMAALVPVPHAASWHAGMLDLRGEVLPVVDLRARLGLGEQRVELDARILVVRAGCAAGLIVDSITGVLEAPAGANEGERHGADRFVERVVRSSDGLILVLDLDAVLAGLAELAGLEVLDEERAA